VDSISLDPDEIVKVDRASKEALESEKSTETTVMQFTAVYVN